MSRHDYDDLMRALGRGDLAPVYYLAGPEDILKEEAVRAIIERALEPAERDFNLDQRNAQGLEPEALHALVNTLPMMAARRVVVIRDIDLWKKKTGAREALDRYLINPATETVLILVERAPGEDRERSWAPDPALLGASYGVAVERLPADRVPRWLAYHARRLGVSFGEGAAEHLALAADYDLGALRSELEKLASLAGDGPVSREQVGDLVGIRHGETIEDWMEAVIADDVARASRLAPRVLEQAGMSGVRMVTAIGTALLGVQLARALHDKGNRGGTLERALWDRMRAVRPAGVPDWGRFVKQSSRGAELWSAARIKAALRAALEADLALKGTRISAESTVIADLTLQLYRGSARRPEGLPAAAGHVHGRGSLHAR